MRPPCLGKGGVPTTARGGRPGLGSREHAGHPELTRDGTGRALYLRLKTKTEWHFPIWKERKGPAHPSHVSPPSPTAGRPFDTAPAWGSGELGDRPSCRRGWVYLRRPWRRFSAPLPTPWEAQTPASFLFRHDCPCAPCFTSQQIHCFLETSNAT